MSRASGACESVPDLVFVSLDMEKDHEAEGLKEIMAENFLNLVRYKPSDSRGNKNSGKSKDKPREFYAKRLN